MDVRLDKPFKGEYWQQLVTSEMGKPHQQDIAKWAWNTWKMIHMAMILSNTWWWVFAWGDEEHTVEQVESNDEEDDNEEDENDDNEIVFVDTAMWKGVGFLVLDND